MTPAQRFFVQVIALSTLIMLAGCGIGGKSKPSSFYLLTPMPIERGAIVAEGDAVPQLGVGQVQIPKYLDRPQMVTMVEPNQIRISEFNRWGESFQAGITRVFRENLSVLLNTDVSAFPWLQPFPRDYAIHLVILDFDAATYKNEVRLRAIYRITDAKQKVTYLVNQSEFTQPIDTTQPDPYPAIADAMSQALVALSRSVAQEVMGLEPVQETAQP